MKPTLGEIVHFVSKSGEKAAIVVAEDPCQEMSATLRVMSDDPALCDWYCRLVTYGFCAESWHHVADEHPKKSKLDQIYIAIEKTLRDQGVEPRGLAIDARPGLGGSEVSISFIASQETV